MSKAWGCTSFANAPPPGTDKVQAGKRSSVALGRGEQLELTDTLELIGTG